MTAPQTTNVPNEGGADRAALREHLLDILRASIRERSEQAVRNFMKRMLALPEAGMRSRILAEKLRTYDAELCLALLSALLERSVRRETKAQQLLLDLCTARPLAAVLGYENTRRVYELAHCRDEERITQLFLFSRNEGARLPGKGFLERENDKLPDESLGWRKKCARGSDRLKLDRLLFDRNPTVIRLLLQNSRIIERDVVKIAAMRPANPLCLHEVFANERWRRRYQVKVALACNPYTPVDIALACVPHLMVPRLKYLATNGKTHPTIRSIAIDILRRRGIRISGMPKPNLSESEEAEQTPEFLVDVERIARELDAWRADEDGPLAGESEDN